MTKDQLRILVSDLFKEINAHQQETQLLASKRRSELNGLLNRLEKYTSSEV